VSATPRSSPRRTRGLGFDPSEERELLDIEQAVRDRAVVYFRLDSDRRPLLTAMIEAGDDLGGVGRETCPTPPS
jgi:hypothetical protein